MKQIGITETFDPCFVDGWETKLLEANIIISKELSDEMIEKLLITQDRVIFHHTVTGQGNSILEPNVKSTEFEFEQFKKLISRGFPISHYVLRVDPIMLFNQTCLNNVRKVFDLWSDYAQTNIVKIRTRVSIIDLYNHVIERFTIANFKIPWKSFTAPQLVFNKAESIMYKYTSFLNFECCAEQNFSNAFINKLGCASNEDLRILNVRLDDYGKPEKKQRDTCMCLAKKQILNVKPSRCGHQCLYCFWK